MGVSLLLLCIVIHLCNAIDLIKQNGGYEGLAILTYAHPLNQSAVSLTIQSVGLTAMAQIHVWVSSDPAKFARGLGCPYLKTFMQSNPVTDPAEVDVLTHGTMECGESVYFAIQVSTVDIKNHKSVGWAQGSRIGGGCQFGYARMFRLELSDDCLSFSVPHQRLVDIVSFSHSSSLLTLNKILF